MKKKKKPVKKGNGLYGHLKKEFGDEGITHLDDESVASNVDGWIPTGSLAMDDALSGGLGIPKGRIVELYGNEASGKTTLALSLIASAQEEGADVLMIDTENALDKTYAKSIGVDISKLIVTQAVETIEDVFKAIRSIARFKLDSIEAGEEVNDVVVVWDSLAATPAASELADEDLNSKEMAVVPRLISRLARIVLGQVQKAKITLIIINQGKTKLGGGFGGMTLTTTPGGKTLKFMATQRIQLYMGSKEKTGKGKVIGQVTRFKITKNKVYPPFGEGEFFIEYGVGIDYDRELLQAGVDCGIVKEEGKGWYTVKGRKKKFQKSSWSEILDDMDDLEDEIVEAVGRGE